MLKRIKERFIIATMVLLISVLAVVITLINIFNYTTTVSAADYTIRLIGANEGEFPDIAGPEYPSIKLPNGSITITPDTPYEVRYFTVEFVGDECVAIDTSNIAAIDEDEALRMAENLLFFKRDEGFVNSYRFNVVEDNGGKIIYFLDCTRWLDLVKLFFVLSLLVSLIVLFLLFVILQIVAERIVRPISDGYEKQKQFITNAGHDIKTPITIIDADAELAEMELGKSEWIDDIRNQTGRLASLTNDLIYLSRMEEMESIPSIDFPLSDMLDEVVTSFASLRKTKNIRLDINITPAIYYCGDGMAIRKMLTIILDNAIKHSPDGGLVSVSLKKQGRRISIQVSNTVTEISDETIKHMFDRFYKSDKSRSTEGFGIGLSVANTIVNAHKGKIGAEKHDNMLSVKITL